MKIFLEVLLSCFIVSVSARPDVSLGYHYNPDYNSGSNLLAPPPQPIVSTSYIPTASGIPTPSYGSTNFLAPNYNVAAVSSASSVATTGSSSFSNGFTSGNNNFGNSGLTAGQSISQGSASGFGQGYIGNAIGTSNQQYGQQDQQLQAPIITKHFYIHSAPEEHDDQEIVRYVTIGRPTTNYRVVFINAPSSSSTRAKIIAKVAPVQERTAIYLLSKKENDLDITTDVVTPAPDPQNKPDVFFIKYNTPEEAIHAQHVIQAQYDKLGGSSDVSNEGNVQVQSVIGSVGSQASAGASSSAQSSSQVTGISSGQNHIQQSGNGNIQPQTSYLPPLIYRRRRYYRY
ncbi:uncharacterized protein LOC129948544 [Eupeodes corollae]|uniref:uncharacterized protein LOC129948544 n=1 Tax=Eupeodes corollae TaxID=290404 RepID=UPI0024900C92|nr:uncharacterized protein LOC129948544 [Eupeodes corollae]